MAKKTNKPLNGNTNQSINVAPIPNQPNRPATGYSRVAKRRTKSDIKETLLGTDPTRDYHSTRYSYFGELFVTNLPLWRIWTGRMMLTSDPVIDFSFAIRNAALMPAEVEITSPNERVRQWVQDQWDFLWNHHRSKLTAAKKYGFAPLQLLYKLEADGLLHIDGVKDFAPEDGRALEVSGNRLCGMRIKGKTIYNPQALWLKFSSEFGNQYGVAITRKQYPSWYEKWMDHGAKRLQQLRMVKDAYIGDIFWYPPNLKVDLPDGNSISWKDLLREVAEHRLSGGAMTLPRVLDSQGKELTGYTPPQNIGGATEIFNWVDYCDDGIFKGAGIPLEVIEAPTTGSGYSGRSIPMIMLFSNVTEEFTEIVQQVDEQVLRVLAWLNFGKDVDYDIKAKNLVESLSDDVSGQPMGGPIGGSAQGDPNQPPPQGQGQQQFEEKQVIPGGKAKDKDLSKYDPEQLKMGLKVEMEHTDDPSVALEIAMDHLTENPKYYTHLKEMEAQFAEETLHAPTGGVTIRGTFYKGGEFIPLEVAHSLTSEERSKFGSKPIKPKTSEEQEHDKLLLSAKEGNKVAIEKVHEQYQPLIKQLANKYAKGTKLFDFEDLVQVGNIGLIKALEGYDPAKSRFMTYAWYGVSNHLKEYVRKDTKVRAKSLEKDEDDNPLEVEDQQVESPSSRSEKGEQLAGLKKAIESLSDREKEVIQRHVMGGETLSSLGDEWGVSKVRVQQIGTKALEKLRGLLGDQQFSELETNELHKFCSTQFNLPGNLAFEVMALASQIDPNDLAEEGIERNPHVTVLYGLHAEAEGMIQGPVTGMGPVAIQLGKCSVFHADMTGKKGNEPDVHDVLKIEVISNGLHEMHKDLKKLPHTCTYPDYKPHITIAYLKPGMGEMYAKRLNLLEGKVAVFDRLIFSNQMREHTSIPLQGTAQFMEGEYSFPFGIPSLKPTSS